MGQQFQTNTLIQPKKWTSERLSPYFLYWRWTFQPRASTFMLCRKISWYKNKCTMFYDRIRIYVLELLSKTGQKPAKISAIILRVSFDIKVELDKIHFTLLMSLFEPPPAPAPYWLMAFCVFSTITLTLFSDVCLFVLFFCFFFFFLCSIPFFCRVTFSVTALWWGLTPMGPPIFNEKKNVGFYIHSFLV